MKADKELKPASLRVKEAAECVLCFIMEQTSLSASLGNTESSDLTRISLDEKALIELTQRPGKFKYGAIDGSLIIAVFEKPLYKAEKSPTLTVLLRGPFTCQAWSLHLRNSSFAKILETQKELKQIKSSENFNNAVFKNPSSTLMGSKEVLNEAALDGSSTGNKSVPRCEISIPSLSEVSAQWVKNLSKFQSIKEEQIKFEMSAVERVRYIFIHTFIAKSDNWSKKICLI